MVTLLLVCTLAAAQGVHDRSAIERAIQLLPPEHRPTVPVIWISPKKVGAVQRKHAEGNCGWIDPDRPTVIFLNTRCAVVDDPVGIRATASTIAHEQAHIRGAEEDEADEIQLKVFEELMQSVGTITPRQQLAAKRFTNQIRSTR